MPAVVEEGVGAVEDPVPPVALVYHSKPVPVAESGDVGAAWQYVMEEVAVGAAGVGFTVTAMAVRGPSQPLRVWLTYHVVVPAEVVAGVGAVVEPVPPVGAVYQSNEVPVAVRVAAVALWQ